MPDALPAGKRLSGLRRIGAPRFSSEVLSRTLVVVASSLAMASTHPLQATTLEELRKAAAAKPIVVNEITVVPAATWKLPGKVAPTVVPASGAAVDTTRVLTHLHGRKRQQKFGEPTEFAVNAPKPWTFGVFVDTVCPDAELTISLDGKEILKRDLPARDVAGKKCGLGLAAAGEWACEYKELVTMQIPAGQHTIRLENTKDNGSWILIKDYVFRDYAAPRVALAQVARGKPLQVIVPVTPGRNRFVITTYQTEQALGKFLVNGKYLGSFGGQPQPPLDNGEAKFEYIASCEGDTAALEMQLLPAYYVKGEPAVYLLDVHSAPSTGALDGPAAFQPRPVEHAVKIAANHRYFQLADGASYFPIGTTLCLAGDAETGGVNNWQDDDKKARTRHWIDKLAAHGVNHVRFVLQPWAYEKAPDEFSAELRAWFNELLHYCAERGMHAEISPIDHYSIFHNESRLSALGRNLGDFFANPKSSDAAWPHFEYLMNGLGPGAHPEIMSWQPFSEVSDGLDAKLPEGEPGVAAFHNHLNERLREKGVSLVSCGLADDQVKPYLDRGFAAKTTASFFSPHYYYWKTDRAAEIAGYSALGKPVMIGESATHIDPANFFSMIWDFVFAGAAGVRTWHADDRYLSDSHLDRLAAMATIARQVNWAAMDPIVKAHAAVPARGEPVGSNRPIRYLADRHGRSHLIWMSSDGGGRLDLAASAEARRATVFDPWTGQVVLEEAVPPDGRFQIPGTTKPQRGAWVVFVSGGVKGPTGEPSQVKAGVP